MYLYFTVQRQKFKLCSCVYYNFSSVLLFYLIEIFLYVVIYILYRDFNNFKIAVKLCNFPKSFLNNFFYYGYCQVVCIYAVNLDLHKNPFSLITKPFFKTGTKIIFLFPKTLNFFLEKQLLPLFQS